jgi:hypothetical protein
MRSSILAALSVGATVAAIGVLTPPAGLAESSGGTGKEPTLFAPPAERVLYGHLKTLTRKGTAYELRVDLAEWLGGMTANRAAAEDGVVAPGEPVPNDYYIVDDDHRLFTYRVPATTPVTVVTRGPRSTRISVAELAAIVKGRNPRRRPLYGPSLGFWLRIATDTVRSLDQQYQP